MKLITGAQNYNIVINNQYDFIRNYCYPKSIYLVMRRWKLKKKASKIFITNFTLRFVASMKKVFGINLSASFNIEGIF